MLSFHVSFCASCSSQRGAGDQIRGRSSCPGLNPAVVGGGGQEEEGLLWVYPALLSSSLLLFLGMGWCSCLDRGRSVKGGRPVVISICSQLQT